MSGTKCQSCTQREATICCSCGPRAYFLCPGCLVGHTDQTAPHLLFPLSAIPPGAPVCDICDVLPAQEICSCAFPLVAYCKACKVGHLAHITGVTHTFLPLTERPLLHSSEELAKAAETLLRTSLAHEMLKRNIDAIESCEQAVNNRCAGIQSALTAAVEEKLKTLEMVREMAREAVSSGIAEAKTLLVEPYAKMETHVGELVAEYMRLKVPDSLVLFRYKDDQKTVNMHGLFGVEWESRLDASGKVSERFIKRMNRTQEGTGTPLNPLDFETVEGYVAACPSHPPTQLRLIYYQAHYAVLQAIRFSHQETRQSMQPDRPVEFWTSQAVCQLMQRTKCQAPQSTQQALSRSVAQDYSLLKEIADLQKRNLELQTFTASLRNQVPPVKRKRGRPPKNGYVDSVKKQQEVYMSPPSPPADLQALFEREPEATS